MDNSSTPFCQRLSSIDGAPGKPQAAFVAITTDMRPWELDETLAPHQRQTVARLGIFTMRWDGRVGFVGGLVDPGESPREAAAREAFEELGAQTAPGAQAHWAWVCSHETDAVAAHLFSWHVEPELFKALLAEQSRAKHWIGEGSAFCAHLRDYGPKKSYANFSRSNFAPAAREELEILVQFLAARHG